MHHRTMILKKVSQQQRLSASQRSDYRKAFPWALCKDLNPPQLTLKHTMTHYTKTITSIQEQEMADPIAFMANKKGDPDSLDYHQAMAAAPDKIKWQEAMIKEFRNHCERKHALGTRNKGRNTSRN